MSRQVSLDESAIDQATAFLADDPEGLRAVLAAIDALAEDPFQTTPFRSGPSDCTGYASGGTECSIP